MNAPREGKKLLVLDLDYSKPLSYRIVSFDRGIIDIFLFSSAIVDTKPLLSGTLPSSECARPGLHDFLEL